MPTLSTRFDANRKLFLTKISRNNGQGQLSYKRYLGSPLRYAGGKSLAVGLIVERIPDKIHRLVSPFLGGGSVEITCAVELGLPVVAYDVFDILCTYWQVQLRHQEELYRRLAAFDPTRATFTTLKNRLRRYWKYHESLDLLDLAAYYYFTHNTSYGPGFLGWPSSVYMNQTRYEKMIDKVRSFRAALLQVECASFEVVLPQHQDDFLYCDPPYYLGEDTMMFRGIYPQRNFPIHHDRFDHKRLRDLLREHRGGFLLSYNDCPLIREWYADDVITTPSWQYTLGQGETRIGHYRPNGSHIKQSHELLIYRPPRCSTEIIH